MTSIIHDVRIIFALYSLATAAVLEMYDPEFVAATVYVLAWPVAIYTIDPAAV